MLNYAGMYRMISLFAGASFASHFRYGHDTIFKVLEAAIDSNDTVTQSTCLTTLSTALQKGHVTFPSHAAVKRTLSLVGPSYDIHYSTLLQRQ